MGQGARVRHSTGCSGATGWNGGRLCLFRAFRNLDLIWTEETVSRLFEIGPQAYTPGTKMPEQTVGNAEERRALIEFLKAATAPK